MTFLNLSRPRVDCIDRALSCGRCFKLWKAGGSRAAYNIAKRTSNHAVHQARSEAEKVALQKIDPTSGDVY